MESQGLVAEMNGHRIVHSEREGEENRDDSFPPTFILSSYVHTSSLTAALRRTDCLVSHLAPTHSTAPRQPHSTRSSPNSLPVLPPPMSFRPTALRSNLQTLLKKRPDDIVVCPSSSTLREGETDASAPQFITSLRTPIGKFKGGFKVHPSPSLYPRSIH